MRRFGMSVGKKNYSIEFDGELTGKVRIRKYKINKMNSAAATKSITIPGDLLIALFERCWDTIFNNLIRDSHNTADVLKMLENISRGLTEHEKETRSMITIPRMHEDRIRIQEMHEDWVRAHGERIGQYTSAIKMHMDELSSMYKINAGTPNSMGSTSPKYAELCPRPLAEMSPGVAVVDLPEYVFEHQPRLAYERRHRVVVVCDRRRNKFIISSPLDMDPTTFGSVTLNEYISDVKSSGVKINMKDVLRDSVAHQIAFHMSAGSEEEENGSEQT